MLHIFSLVLVAQATGSLSALHSIYPSQVSKSLPKGHGEEDQSSIEQSPVSPVIPRMNAEIIGLSSKDKLLEAKKFQAPEIVHNDQSKVDHQDQLDGDPSPTLASQTSHPPPDMVQFLLTKALHVPEDKTDLRSKMKNPEFLAMLSKALDRPDGDRVLKYLKKIAQRERIEQLVNKTVEKQFWKLVEEPVKHVQTSVLDEPMHRSSDTVQESQVVIPDRNPIQPPEPILVTTESVLATQAIVPVRNPIPIQIPEEDQVATNSSIGITPLPVPSTMPKLTKTFTQDAKQTTVFPFMFWKQKEVKYP